MNETQHAKKLWPEMYGFYIYGNGPTYVIYVENASISDIAGIRVGDRIIELDNQDVSNQPSHILKYIARNSRNNPPSISVQSCSQLVELIPDNNLLKTRGMNAYGFTIKGDMPILVDQIVENCLAYFAGMRPGN
jgi:hypothetical protein